MRIDNSAHQQARSKSWNTCIVLCEEYKATFSDEGIHINADGEEVFIGFMFVDAPKELRDAAEV